MNGAIAVAEMCRPGVEEIRTYAAGQPDTAYFKSGGAWQMKSIRDVGSSTTSKETAKKPYHEPKVIDYGTVADLTKKPGSRADGPGGAKGNKGMGS